MLVEDKDPVLELADQIMAEIELDQPSPSSGWSAVKPEFPRALRLQFRIAAVDARGRQVGDADEIIEIELRDGAADGKLSVPGAARLPVDRQRRLEEFQRAIRDRVSANLELREFVVEAAVDAQGRRQRLADD